MSVRAALVDARKLIDDPKRWVQGSFRHGLCFCVAGAVREVIEHDPLPALRHVAETINPSFKLDMEGDYSKLDIEEQAIEVIAAFNDADDRKHGEVLALMDRAIESAS